ncbi:MAG: AAA family ATPase [Acidobacteria bacterium]|nr:AAA family ATPase [Acidobacteriota bacterium]
MENSTQRFLHLTVRGFRRLANVDLELRPLAVLIGANGVGKSSLLDALSVLASSAQGNLNASVIEMSGLPAMMTYDRAGEIGFGISMTVPNYEPLGYSLSLRPQGTAYRIDRETLNQRREGYPDPFNHIDSRGGDIKYYEVEKGKLVRPNWEHNPLESSLSQVPKLFRSPEEFRRRLASSTYYHVLNVEPGSPVRLPQTMRPAALPGKNGEDLVSSLYYLREAEPDRFEVVEDSLKAAFPGFKRLDFPPVAAGTLAMTWRDNSFSKPLYMHQLSEGMLRFVWLATLLQSPGLTALTLLDEPEVSLHPELLSLLAGLLREAAQRTQIVVATHSDRLVRFLKPSEVVVMDTADDGTSTLTWADKLNLEQWLEEYTLDELWRNGRLGARG